MIKRRQFIAGLGSAAAWPLAARAQGAQRMRRVGVLLPHTESDPDAQARVATFRRALQELGWTDGRNIQIDQRFAANLPDRIRAFATELIGLTPDAILADSTLVLSALREATQTVPIVFVQVGNPVARGFVPSLARPSGNITGFTNFESAMAGKWLGLLKEIAPKVTRIAVIYQDPELANVDSYNSYISAIEAVAASFGIELFPSPVHDVTGIEHAVVGLGQESNSGVLVLPGPFITVSRDLLVALLAMHGIPAIYPYRFFASSGGLLAYGPDTLDPFRRAASYIDRILKGEKPVDLPVQAPTKFEFVINLKTAKALGLTIPETLLATADEVIQ
jgi:putative tryptophan/tyrosine transport system substrate-binding protein